MSRRAILSTLYETFYEECEQVKPRVRLEMSDGTIGKLASEFGDRYRSLWSGSTLISVIENGVTLSMARVDEFERGRLLPAKLTYAFGPEIVLAELPTIEDKRWKTFKGHPLEQIPEPRSMECKDDTVFHN